MPEVTIAELYRRRWQVDLILPMDQAAPTHQGVLWNLRERGENTNLDRHLSLCPRRYRQEAAEPAANAP
jgi:hypothetical protein